MTEQMPGALVAGWSAHVADKLLARHLATFLGLMSREDRAEVVRTAAAVHAASQLYDERRTSAIGSAETDSAEIRAGSRTSVLVSVRAAALLAGVSERRCRQLATRLAVRGPGPQGRPGGFAVEAASSPFEAQADTTRGMTSSHTELERFMSSPWSELSRRGTMEAAIEEAELGLADAPDVPRSRKR